jgi:hypothetical protein
MKNVSAVVAIWVGLAMVPVTAADGIQPGLWKITTVALNNGMKMPPQTNARCLTAEQANDLADTFSPRFGGMNTTCQRTQYAKTEQKLTWRLECRGQFNMDSAAEFTFFQPASLYGCHLDERLDRRPAALGYAGDARGRICRGLSVKC